MKKITSINVTNNYVQINLSDASAYKISDNDYFDFKYKANDPVDLELENQLKQQANYHAGYMSSLNKLKYKDRTEYEIRAHLYDDFKLLKNEVDAILDKLIYYDFINDDRYTKDLIENNQLKYYGYNKIKSNLIKVYINSNRISEFLVYNYEVEYDLAFEFASKTLNSIKNKTKIQTENTLKQKLVYRGFNSDVINNVVSALEVSVDSDIEYGLLIKEYTKAERRYSRKYSDYELRTRIINFLLAKGYNYSMVQTVMEEMEKEND